MNNMWLRVPSEGRIATGVGDGRTATGFGDGQITTGFGDGAVVVFDRYPIPSPPPTAAYPAKRCAGPPFTTRSFATQSPMLRWQAACGLAAAKRCTDLCLKAHASDRTSRVANQPDEDPEDPEEDEEEPELELELELALGLPPLLGLAGPALPRPRPLPPRPCPPGARPPALPPRAA